MFIKKQIGKTVYSFVVDGKNLYELVRESQKLSFPDVLVCGMCGSDDLYLNSREAGTKKFEYVEIRCKNCKCQLQFGKTQADSNVVYLRKRELKDGTRVLDWKKVNDDNTSNCIDE